jgi:hypothetical protein
MNDLPPAVVNSLIELGGLDDCPSATREQLLTRLKPFERVNRLGWDRWNEVADTLPEAELRNLVRGLTAAELELRWCGGSVASVIWVCPGRPELAASELSGCISSSASGLPASGRSWCRHA